MSMTYGILLLILQVAFAVHAFRCKHDLFWIILIVFVPLLGCILYALVILIPEARQSRTARGAQRALKVLVDPQGNLREQAKNLDLADTVDNRIRLAEELLKHNRIDEAAACYEKSLTGIYVHDPVLMFGYAKTLFAQNNFTRCLEVLTELKQYNPALREQECHLLLARTLEALGDYDAACREYTAVVRYFSGSEAKCRYAQLLKRLERPAEARSLFEDILKAAGLTSDHGRQLNREWIAIAKEEISGRYN